MIHKLAGRRWVINVGLLCLIVASASVVYPVILMKAMCFSLFAAAFNLAAGYGGLFSFGHAAFFGGATYAVALSLKELQLPTELGLLIGTMTGAGLAAIFCLLAVRRRGIYFAMITLSLAQIVYFIIYKAGVTGGDDGMQGVPRGSLFGVLDLDDQWTLFSVILLIFASGLFAIHWIVHSPFGQIVRAIRDNENRATSLGYNPVRIKLLLFTLSGALSGLAGSANCLILGIASISDVHWSMSGQVVLMTLVGGLGTIVGPAIGAFVIVALEHYLAPYGSWTMIVRGLIFLLCVMAFRRGIVGVAMSLASKLNALQARSRRASAGQIVTVEATEASERLKP